MAEPNLPDPFAMFRDWMSQMEKGVNEYASPMMKTEGFARDANSVMAAQMTAKKLAEELSQRYFEAFNIPSRSDILALTDRMQMLEDRMIAIQSTLDRVAGGAGPSALRTPARTRKPPTPVVEVGPTPKRVRKTRS